MSDADKEKLQADVSPSTARGGVVSAVTQVKIKLGEMMGAPLEEDVLPVTTAPHPCPSGIRTATRTLAFGAGLVHCLQLSSRCSRL